MFAFKLVVFSVLPRGGPRESGWEVSPTWERQEVGTPASALEAVPASILQPVPDTLEDTWAVAIVAQPAAQPRACKPRSVPSWRW